MMNIETGRIREIPEPQPPTPMEIPFAQGETVEIKGQPFKVRSINVTTHEITLRSAKYQPGDLQAAQDEMDRLNAEIDQQAEKSA